MIETSLIDLETMYRDQSFDIGAPCLFDTRIQTTVIDKDGDYYRLEWTAENGYTMGYDTHISRLLQIDAPRFTYKRALARHQLAVCAGCERVTIVETFCYDCGSCARCCPCEDES